MNWKFLSCFQRYQIAFLCCLCCSYQNFYEKPAFDYPMNQMSVWLMLANEGMVKNETFCSATPSAMVFGKSDGDRFAVTRDLTLKPGYVLQFKVFMHKLFFFFNMFPSLFYLFTYLFIYLFLAVLGPRFCARAPSSCGKRGPLFITVHGPLTIAVCLVAEHRLQTRRLSSCGSRA